MDLNNERGTPFTLRLGAALILAGFLALLAIGLGGVVSK